MATTMMLSVHNRERLAAIALSELHGVSLDSALAMLLLEHESASQARLSPEQLVAMRVEAQTLAGTDVARTVDAWILDA